MTIYIHFPYGDNNSYHDKDKDLLPCFDNGGHIEEIYMIKTGKNIPAKQDDPRLANLILGKRIKILKIGKVIQLNAERRKLCK